MRTIKFRAWDKESKKMFFPDSDNNSDTFWCGFEGKRGIRAVAPDESNYPLMQFTGLLDKNGNEIYEGDIIECVVNMIDRSRGAQNRQVFFNDGCFECGAVPLKILIPSFEPLVVGNIYENPELL